MVVNIFHDDKRKTRDFMITRRQSGLLNGQNLAAWLNLTPGNNPERSRSIVLQAIHLLRKMNKQHASRSNAYPDNSPAGRRLRADWQGLGLILRKLTPMKWTINPYGWGYVLELEYPTSLEHAFSYLSAITEAGVLDRVRECKRGSCQNWFMALRQDKVFCSPECQQEHWFEYRKSPLGLKEQAERMA